MDKLKAFVSDKKNTPIVAAVAGILIVLVVLFYLKQFGIIGGGASQGDSTANDMSIPADPSAPADPGAAAPPAGGAAAPATGAPPTGGAAPAGGATGSAAAPAAGADVAKEPPMFAYRKDPFMGFSGTPKKQDAMMAILPNVRRIRLAPVAPARLTASSSRTSVDIQEVLPPQPMRRVAGIMWGPTVKAIIESGGKTHVVQPGEQIPGEPVRVESIEPSGVILTTLNTKHPMSIRVNLAGAPAAEQAADMANTGNQGPAPNPYANRGSRGGGSPMEAPPPGF